MLAGDQKLICSGSDSSKSMTKKLNKIFKNFNFLIYLRKVSPQPGPIRSGFTVLTLVP